MAVDNDKRPIAIIVAVRREGEAVLSNMFVQEIREIASQHFYICGFDSRKIIVAVLGIGRQKAMQGTDTLIQKYSPSALVSLGFAGAINSHLPRGRVILGKDIFTDTNQKISFNSTPMLLEKAEKGLKKALITYSTGKIITVSEPLFGAYEKRALEMQQQYLAVDMETAAVAEIANREGIPFLSIRFILDEVQDDLKFIFACMGRNGRLSPLQVGRNILLLSKMIKTYLRLRRCWAISCKSIRTSLIPVLREIVEYF